MLKMYLAENQYVVSLKNLHKELGIKSNYELWSNALFDSDFVEGVDYRLSGVDDFELSLDCAHKIAAVYNKGNSVADEIEQKRKSSKVLKLQLNAAYAEIERLNGEISKNTEKIKFADAVASCKDCISISELNMILYKNGVRIGTKRLFALLRSDGYLLSRSEDNLPSQKSLEAGLLEVEHSFYRQHGMLFSQARAVVTWQGVQFFVNKYLKYVKDNPVSEIIDIADETEE